MHIIAKYLYGFTDNEHEKPLMVHGAGIQVAVIRVFPNRITACLECGNSSHMQEHANCNCGVFSAWALGVHGLVKVAVIWCCHLSYHSLLWLVCDRRGCNVQVYRHFSSRVPGKLFSATLVNFQSLCSLIFSRNSTVRIFFSQCWYVLASVIWTY